VLRSLVGLAIIEAIVEDESREALGCNRQIEPRKCGLATATVNVIQVYEKREVPVAIGPSLTRVVVVVMGSVKLSRVVAHNLQRLDIRIGVAAIMRDALPNIPDNGPILH